MKAGKNGKRYTDEFKLKIVELYNEGSSATYLSKEYDISSATIYNWINQLPQVNVSNVKEMVDKDKRISELEMENAELKTENEMLKKTAIMYMQKK